MERRWIYHSYKTITEKTHYHKLTTQEFLNNSYNCPLIFCKSDEVQAPRFLLTDVQHFTLWNSWNIYNYLIPLLTESSSAISLNIEIVALNLALPASISDLIYENRGQWLTHISRIMTYITKRMDIFVYLLFF